MKNSCKNRGLILPQKFAHSVKHHSVEIETTLADLPLQRNNVVCGALTKIGAISVILDEELEEEASNK